MDFQSEINNKTYLQEFEIEKSANPELISVHELSELLKSGYDLVETEDSLTIEKSEKDLSKLIKKQVWVKNAKGKSYQMTVYVKASEPEKKVETPIGEELSPEVKGMNITKYSDKALLITGDTKVNLETLRDIKKDINVGSWNNKLGGWVFPLKYAETVLGYIWSGLKEKGEDEKADAVQNQKNAALQTGDKAEINGTEIEVKENVSDSEGTKYNVKLGDGTELNGVDEKVIDKKPETDDKKIADAVNNASPENRVSTEKKIYGIQPIKNIQNYTLAEYMGMHGLDQTDIDKAIAAFTKPKDEGKKRSGGGSGTPKTKKEGGEQSMTKKQLIAKLIYAHYQAVQAAVKAGETVKPEVLATYADLQKEFKDRKPMSEETKRKISESLKKNKVDEPENPQIEKENEETEKQGFDTDIDKENYKPKDGEDYIFKSPKNQIKSEVVIKTKDYTDIPPLDIMIPKTNKILEVPKPYFIPEIDMYDLKRSSYTLQASKIGEDKYLVALDGFETRGAYSYSTASINKSGRFAVMSLDMYAATQQYYQIKAKQEFKQEQTKNIEDRIVLAEKGLSELHLITDADKKERTERQLKHTLEYYKKQKPSKRVKILPDTRMTYTQSHMIEATHQDAEGNPPSRSKIWEIYREMTGDRKQKAMDLDMQQEYIDSAYTKGAETSYGDSGTKDTLMKDYGIKVKRQNGDEITDSEIKQIKEAVDVTSKLFGNNVEMNKEFGLKISHAGSMMMHARKAVGLFHPAYSAIGVSAMEGEKDFQFTFGHEYAHFMDYWIGKKTGNHYASDKEGSTANQIAKVFRKNMNKSQKSDYQNRTCECLARSPEQYTAIETYGKDAGRIGTPYVTLDNHVNFDVYEKQLKPLIKQLLQENKNILKGTLFDIMK